MPAQWNVRKSVSTRHVAASSSASANCRLHGYFGTHKERTPGQCQGFFLCACFWHNKTPRDITRRQRQPKKISRHHFWVSAIGVWLAPEPVLRCLGQELAGDGARSNHLSHQVVVPIAFYYHVTRCAQFEGLDQVVVHVGIYTRLGERVDGRSGGAAWDEPGFDVTHRCVRELAQRPEPVCVTPD